MIKYHTIKSGEKPKVISFPGKAKIEGIETCMGVAILNYRKRKAYVGEYFNFDTSSEALVDQAISEARKIGDLEVVLVGNIPLSRADAEFCKDDFQTVLEQYREHERWALQMLESKGITRVRNHLEQDPVDGFYKMMVYTATKRIEVEKCG